MIWLEQETIKENQPGTIPQRTSLCKNTSWSWEFRDQRYKMTCWHVRITSKSCRNTPPKKLTCPLNTEYSKRTFHLPTIIFWGSTFLLLGKYDFWSHFAGVQRGFFFPPNFRQFFQAKKSLASRPSTCFASTSRVPWPRFGCDSLSSTTTKLVETRNDPEAFPSYFLTIFFGMSFCSITWKKLTQQVPFKNNPSPARFLCHQLTYLVVLRSSRILTSNEVCYHWCFFNRSDLENRVNIETKHPHESWRCTKVYCCIRPISPSPVVKCPHSKGSRMQLSSTPRFKNEQGKQQEADSFGGVTFHSQKICASPKWDSFGGFRYFPLDFNMSSSKSGNHEPKTCPFPYPIKKVKKVPVLCVEVAGNQHHTFSETRTSSWWKDRFTSWYSEKIAMVPNRFTLRH